MTDEMRHIISQLARQQALSPARTEGFEAGAEAVVQLIAELGIQQTVFPEVRKEKDELLVTLQQVRREHETLRALFTPTNIDDRARAALAFTGLMLDLFRDRLTQAGDGRFHQIGLSDDVQKLVVKAVSYAVWAYLNPGVVTPD